MNTPTQTPAVATRRKGVIRVKGGWLTVCYDGRYEVFVSGKSHGIAETFTEAQARAALQAAKE